MAEEFSWDAVEDEEEAPATLAKDSFRQLRDHAKTLERQNKAAAKELEELRKFRADFEARERQSKVRRLFNELNVRDGYAKWFPADVEPTAEAVAGWIRENADLVGLEVSQEVEQAETFSPVSIGIPPSTRLTHAQYKDLLNSDPARAIQAVNEGRVDGMYRNPV
jgi:hypothetical protein